MRQRVADALQEHTCFRECREVYEEINYDNEEMSQQLRIGLRRQGKYESGKLTPP